MDIILERLDAIDRRLAIIEANTRRMDNHINGVESVWSTVRHPISSLLWGVGDRLPLQICTSSLSLDPPHLEKQH